MYSSTLSLTSALDAVGGQRHAPAALPPGKTRYPLYRRLGGPVWTGAENLISTGIRSPDRPACSESLYRLSHPGPTVSLCTSIYSSFHSYFLSPSLPLPLESFFHISFCLFILFLLLFFHSFFPPPLHTLPSHSTFSLHTSLFLLFACLSLFYSVYQDCIKKLIHSFPVSLSYTNFESSPQRRKSLVYANVR